MATYWNNKGKYEAEAAELNDLVPAMGATGTNKGEIWRAATKIYYDHFNNGFGNTWMAPAAFLMTHVKLPSHVEQVLFDHAKGNVAHGSYDEEMDLMIDTVIEALREKELLRVDWDMWEFKVDYDMERQFEDEWEEEDYWDDEEEYDY